MGNFSVHIACGKFLFQENIEVSGSESGHFVGQFSSIWTLFQHNYAFTCDFHVFLHHLSSFSSLITFAVLNPNQRSDLSCEQPPFLGQPA